MRRPGAGRRFQDHWQSSLLQMTTRGCYTEVARLFRCNSQWQRARLYSSFFTFSGQTEISVSIRCRD